MAKFSPQDNMNISGNVKEIDVEELTECPECESEHIVRITNAERLLVEIVDSLLMTK